MPFGLRIELWQVALRARVPFGPEVELREVAVRADLPHLALPLAPQPAPRCGDLGRPAGRRRRGGSPVCGARGKGVGWQLLGPACCRNGRAGRLPRRLLTLGLEATLMEGKAPAFAPALADGRFFFEAVRGSCSRCRLAHWRRRVGRLLTNGPEATPINGLAPDFAPTLANGRLFNAVRCQGGRCWVACRRRRSRMFFVPGLAGAKLLRALLRKQIQGGALATAAASSGALGRDSRPSLGVVRDR
mmetsp:Transcript_75302/g.207734  ORF Transcript_75302/g.207734 Transcript_75302/m.207734 type:complete len:245 (-) Transcript_75302:303-1037(-)